MENRLDPERGFFLEEWFVEPELCRVSKGARVVRVEPKVMDVLVLLALNRNRVLRKDEIINRIWGEVNVVENVLARAISEIRKVFGDDAKKQGIVQTIPKVGYRLVANISQGDRTLEILTEAPVMDMPLQSNIAPFNKNSFWIGAGAAFLFVAAVLLILVSAKMGTVHSHEETEKVIIRQKSARPNG